MTNFFQKLGLGLKKSSTRLTSGLSGIFKNAKLDPQTLEELEELLISSDLGIKATNQIIGELKERRLPADTAPETLKEELARIIESILTPVARPLDVSTTTAPAVILMVGVNGAGKTTTIGKLAHRFPDKKISFIAADTFRAAAVEQLEIWGRRNNIRVYKGAPGCDAAALCFDGLQEALRQGDELVFIDTAGRLQNKTGLMDELQKIIRVIKKVIPQAPHHTLLTIDATTGQNALDQIRTFQQLVNVSGLIVTKLDGSAKGGILIAAAAETALPVYYIGIGEALDDLDVFNARDFTQNLLGF